MRSRWRCRPRVGVRTSDTPIREGTSQNVMSCWHHIIFERSFGNWKPFPPFSAELAGNWKLFPSVQRRKLKTVSVVLCPLFSADLAGNWKPFLSVQQRKLKTVSASYDRFSHYSWFRDMFSHYSWFQNVPVHFEGKNVAVHFPSYDRFSHYSWFSDRFYHYSWFSNWALWKMALAPKIAKTRSWKPQIPAGLAWWHAWRRNYWIRRKRIFVSYDSRKRIFVS